MKRSRVLFVRSFWVSLACAAVAAGAQTVWAQGPPAAPVRFTEAREYQVRRSVILTGSVESRRISVVASEVEGVVEQLMAREGDQVKKGQPLVKLRRTNLQLRLAAERGQLQEAEARQNLATTSLERSRGLHEEKIISQQQLDDAASEFEAWGGRVAQLQAEVARLEDDLARTTVRAPFAGVVVRELVAEGEWLGAGGSVAELLDFGDLEVTVNVPESSFAGLRVGSPARVVIQSLGGVEVEGQVRAVVPRADARARSFPAKIAITNLDGRIAVGMLAQVHLLMGEPVEAVIVPKDAVVTKRNETTVFRIKDDNTAESVTVQVGSAIGVWVAVTGDVRPGDRLITRGNERVSPGQSVEPQVQDYPLP